MNRWLAGSRKAARAELSNSTPRSRDWATKRMAITLPPVNPVGAELRSRAVTTIGASAQEGPKSTDLLVFARRMGVSRNRADFFKLQDAANPARRVHSIALRSDENPRNRCNANLADVTMLFGIVAMRSGNSPGCTLSGWDCPRAEVMVSFRSAKDRTHITQLLGRMVRTPLARRIPGNERLNAVDCLLPFFDEQSVKDIASSLMSGSDGGDELPGRRVLLNPTELTPNPAIPDLVWAKLLSLPSQSLPKKHARPVKRLTSLAHELAADGLLRDAGKKAHSEMYKVMNSVRARYEEETDKARKAVLTVEGRTLTTDLRTREMSFDDFLEAADYAVIDDAYRRAGRTIGAELAGRYSEYVARTESSLDDDEEALVEAHVTVAALGLVPEAKAYLEAEAEKLATRRLTKYHVEIKSLSDERQEVYRQIREMSAQPLDVEVARPKSWMQPTTIREADGSQRSFPRFERHLLCADDGLFREDFNSWEEEVLRTELRSPGTVAWYRNPPRASQDSLGVIYEEGNENKTVRPDFIFFAQLSNETIVADIVDPHCIQFSDAVPKLKGLARYAATHGSAFRRIDAVAKLGDTFRVLDLTEQAVRSAVESATSIRALYESEVATDYTP